MHAEAESQVTKSTGRPETQSGYAALGDTGQGKFGDKHLKLYFVGRFLFELLVALEHERIAVRRFDHVGRAS